MKTTMIARCVFAGAAIFAAAGLIGCGAESGQGESGAIGSTSEALTVNTNVKDLKDAVDINDGNITDPVAREFPATCVIKDGATGTFKLFLAGGYDATGAALTDAYLYNSANDKWTQMEPLPEPRGEAKAVQISETTCLISGGLTAKSGGSVVTQARLFTADGSDGSWSAAGSTTGRAKFALSKCGTGSKAVMIGGETAAHGALTTMEIYNGETGTTAWGSLGTLNTATYAFGFATEDKQNFFIHSGYNGSSTVDRIQILSVSASCGTLVKNEFAIVGGGSPVGGSKRYGHVAITTGTANRFAVVAGDDLSSLLESADIYDVNFASPAVTKNSTVANSLPSGHGQRFPTLVNTSGSTWLLIGGENRSAVLPLSATPLNFVHEYASGAYSTGSTLGEARLGSGAEYLSSPNRVYAATGKIDSTHWSTLTASITP